MSTHPTRLLEPSITPFALWIRTGKWVPNQVGDPTLEVKFNPNHDPESGRFTFKNGGGGSHTSRSNHAHSSANRPKPVRLNDGSTVANPRSPTGILLQPPEVSLAKNAAEGASWLGVTANAHMVDNFRPGGAMDYQRTFGSEGRINRDYIDFGNYNYGVVSAAGYTLEEAQVAAGAINLLGKGDKSGDYYGNPRNQSMIAAGWRDYMHGKISK